MAGPTAMAEVKNSIDNIGVYQSACRVPASSVTSTQEMTDAESRGQRLPLLDFDIQIPDEKLLFCFFSDFYSTFVGNPFGFGFFNSACDTPNIYIPDKYYREEDNGGSYY